MSRLFVAALGLGGLWLLARAVEVRRGLRPALTMSGFALVWPQRDPRVVPLTRHVLGSAGAPALLLLHGLGASSALWMPTAHELATAGFRVVVPDLLGFGGSRRIGTTFTLADHTAALWRLPELREPTQITVVGHSYGCAIAVALAESKPDRVQSLVLVSPPVFDDAGAAPSGQGWLIRGTLTRSRVAMLTCAMMCVLRVPLGVVAPWLRRDLPPAVARDAVAHTWPAVRDAVHTLIESNPIRSALERPQVPTTVIIGTDDPVTPPSSIRAINARAPVVELTGDHFLPLRRPAALAAALVGESRGGADIAAGSEQFRALVVHTPIGYDEFICRSRPRRAS